MWSCGQLTVCPECTVLPPRRMVSTGQLQNENEFGQLRHQGHPQLWVAITWPCAVCRGKLIWQQETWGPTHTHLGECGQPRGHRLVCVGVRTTGRQQQPALTVTVCISVKQLASDLSPYWHCRQSRFGHLSSWKWGIGAARVFGQYPSASVKLLNIKSYTVKDKNAC